MQLLTDTLFSQSNLEKLVKSQTRLSTTFFETQTCRFGPFCDDDEDID